MDAAIRAMGEVLAKEREECASTPSRPLRGRRHAHEAAALWRSLSS